VTGPNGTRVLHLQKVAGISGSEAHLLSLLPRLRERGWDIRMLMLHENEPGAWDFARALEARGVPLDAMRLRADVDPLAFFQLVGYLARHRPGDPAHAPRPRRRVRPDGRDARARAGPFLDEARIQRVPRGPGLRVRRPHRCQLRPRPHRDLTRLARYLAQTEGFREDSFEIVHYGITPNGEPKPYVDETPRLLCVGRLIPIKGHIVLLRAFAAAKKEVPGLELDIAGRGPLEPALRALTRELGIADSVRFLGYVAPIQSAIERSAIVVVPSMGEGFGMVALEAMERARPVIAAEIGGLGELVRDGETGLLVTPGEAEPLREAIVRLRGTCRWQPRWALPAAAVRCVTSSSSAA
jgi:glycosyltransferase involved in cell wall biosynthesis